MAEKKTTDGVMMAMAPNMVEPDCPHEDTKVIGHGTYEDRGDVEVHKCVCGWTFEVDV